MQRILKLCVIIQLTFLVLFCYSQDDNSKSNVPEGGCEIKLITGPKILCLDKQGKFNATTNPPNCPVNWTGGGEPKTSATASFNTTWSTVGKKELTAFCTPSGKSKPYDVQVIKILSKINNTDDEKDDYICVSKSDDEDRPFRELQLDLEGEEGLSVKVKLQSSGDGEVEFDKESVVLTVGTTSTIEVYGKEKSSALNSTKVEFIIEDTGEKCGEEDLTVFEGIKLEFSGNFYLNVDVREFGWRPWDGRPDPKYATPPNNIGDIYPNATEVQKAQYKKAVDQDAQYGYINALSFKKGDNKDLKKYRPWIDALKVEVTKVYSDDPSIELEDDPLMGSIVSVKQGFLSGTPAFEKMIKPEITFGDFFKISGGTASKDTSLVTGGGENNITKAQMIQNIINQIGNGHDELISMMQQSDRYVNDYITRNSLGASWKNDSYEVKDEAKIKDSLAATCLKKENEAGKKVIIGFTLKHWDMFKLQGSVKKGLVETEANE